MATDGIQLDDPPVNEEASAHRTTRVALELEPGEPLRGSLDSELTSQRFCGWLELATALDAARDAGGNGLATGGGEPGEVSDASS